jgi:pSer/pThr/pTyr-binding forkhead associated (FHA) protein
VDVSRHHCLVEIEPPVVRVRDLGSLNGTFVNDKLIGSRLKTAVVMDRALGEVVERELKDGDEIRLGHTVLQVGLEGDGPVTCHAAEGAING